MMQSNLGSTDRIIRVVIGIILAAAGFMLAGALLKTLLFVAAAIALATSAASFCPLYKLFGINTCGKA